MTSRMLFCVIATLGVLTTQAGATPYWVAYEGDAFPENVGWDRHWGVNVPPGDPNSVPERSIEDGAFVLDTTSDIWMYDYYQIDRSIDPDPGELFVAEWRVAVDELLVYWDAGVVFTEDDPPGDIGFRFGVDTLFVGDGNLTYEIGPGVHTYRFESTDMVEYSLYVDGGLVHEGTFESPSSPESFVSFGNGAAGASSLSRWDYMRFGVVPEPNTLLLFGHLIATIGYGGMRRR